MLLPFVSLSFYISSYFCLKFVTPWLLIKQNSSTVISIPKLWAEWKAPLVNLPTWSALLVFFVTSTLPPQRASIIELKKRKSLFLSFDRYHKYRSHAYHIRGPLKGSLTVFRRVSLLSTHSKYKHLCAQILNCANKWRFLINSLSKMKSLSNQYLISFSLRRSLSTLRSLAGTVSTESVQYC